jgi:hypothetical protein
VTDPTVPPPPPSGGFPPPPPDAGGFAPPPDAGGFAPPPGAGAVGYAPTGGHPLHLELDAPLEVANWRPLVHWLLVIPYAIVTGILGYALMFVAFIAFFTVVFTKKIPQGMFNFMAMCLRVSWRANSYQFFLREPYPNWTFDSSAVDPGDDPATLSIEDPGEMSRLLPFVKWLLVIPHLIALVFLLIGAYVALIIGFFAVLFTGRWPEGVRNYVIGVSRWGFRVGAYAFYMTDDYPPFSLD